jgi:hypothetical protein
MRVLGRLDRLAARFNRWFGATAVAAGAERSAAIGGGPPVVDPTAIVGVMGEIEREGAERSEPAEDSEQR